MKRHPAQAPALLLASKNREFQRRVRLSLATAGLASGGLVIVRNELQWQEALHRERPQLVILDDDIAAGNGPALLRSLRLRLPEVLTVYVAKQHTAELERTVRQLGVLYYTAKPPDWDTLSRVFASVLSPSLPPPSGAVASSTGT